MIGAGDATDLWFAKLRRDLDGDNRPPVGRRSRVKYTDAWLGFGLRPGSRWQSRVPRNRPCLLPCDAIGQATEPSVAVPILVRGADDRKNSSVICVGRASNGAQSSARNIGPFQLSPVDRWGHRCYYLRQISLKKPSKQGLENKSCRPA